MSVMSERIERIRNLLKGRLDKVLIGSMLFIMLIVGLLAFLEYNSPEPSLIEPLAKDPKGKIDPKAVEYQVVQFMAKRLPEFDASPFVPLTVFNMFDPKAAKDSERMAKEADQLVSQARDLFNENKFEEARKVAEKAAKMQAQGYPPAKALLEEIEKKMKPPAPAGK